MYSKTKDATKEDLCSIKNYILKIQITTNNVFGSVPCGSENSQSVVQLNPNEDKYYLLHPNPP